MAKEMMKDANNAVSREVANIRNTSGSVLRDDLETLKADASVVLDDARVLGRDLKEEGKKQLSYAEERAKEALEQAKAQGKDQYAHLTQFVQSNPGQSLAIAFVGGIIASMLMGRK